MLEQCDDGIRAVFLKTFERRDSAESVDSHHGPIGRLSAASSECVERVTGGYKPPEVSIDDY